MLAKDTRMQQLCHHQPRYYNEQFEYTVAKARVAKAQAMYATCCTVGAKAQALLDLSPFFPPPQ